MDKQEEEMVAKDDNKNAEEAGKEEEEKDRPTNEDGQPNELMSDDVSFYRGVYSSNVLKKSPSFFSFLPSLLRPSSVL